jgi:hypothetical protein
MATPSGPIVVIRSMRARACADSGALPPAFALGTAGVANGALEHGSNSAPRPLARRIAPCPDPADDAVAGRVLRRQLGERYPGGDARRASIPVQSTGASAGNAAPVVSGTPSARFPRASRMSSSRRSAIRKATRSRWRSRVRRAGRRSTPPRASCAARRATPTSATPRHRHQGERRQGDDVSFGPFAVKVKRADRGDRRGRRAAADDQRHARDHRGRRHRLCCSRPSAPIRTATG